MPINNGSNFNAKILDVFRTKTRQVNEQVLINLKISEIELP